ncbi:hypothetical protein L6164_022072 [Bauhinia variegata]|uniref:Uncharacterized protein n=1 Tax=Bauhinia variegata TaxID=167791 RepID=A0ACB9MFV8_BAUVA|nr:hypothetical protein L6164_022072 [Bauhinia variegata]
MPSPKSHRNGQIEANRRGRLGEKSSSFYGQSSATMSSQLRRPKTVPDLASYRKLSAGASPEALPRHPPKLLLNVTMMGSLGPIQVIMTPESTVGELVASAVRQYLKECRRPMLLTPEPSDYDLHYSQFSLESLDREEKLIQLGSRNFVLCPRKMKTSTATGDSENGSGGGVTTTRFASCSKEADKVAKSGFHWFKFMGFSP